jgi:hypothetical protein
MYTATRVSEAKALYFDPYPFSPCSKFISFPSPAFAVVMTCYVCCILIHLTLYSLFDDVSNSDNITLNDWMIV